MYAILRIIMHMFNDILKLKNIYFGWAQKQNYFTMTNL